MRRTLMILLWMSCSFAALAQDRVVSGTVTDETGNPMPGVNVLVKGTTTGNITDVNGQFKINAKESDVLLITFVGYATTEVNVGNQTDISVSLKADLTSLDEVVVTGYSIDKRRDLTGSVSTVKTKDITFAPAGNVEQMLQGRVPGVTVISNGQPGTTSQIRIRGFGSFTSNRPLYIVDGVPTQDTSFLNPDDIETTTVLKDAGSASIYGARAAAGVIVYTTKKGKRGQKLAVTYDGLAGFTNPGKGQSMMNPTDFADYTWRAIKNTEDARAFDKGVAPNYDSIYIKYNHPQFGKGSTPVIPEYINLNGAYGVTGPSQAQLDAANAAYNVDPRKGAISQIVKANKAGTDWYDAITANAPVFRNTIGLNGGSETSRFYIGLSSYNQKGILKNQGLNRYALRANTEFDVLKNFRIGENFQATYYQKRGILDGSGQGGLGVAADENEILSAFRMPSIIPVYDERGNYAGTSAKGFNNPANPLAARDGQVNNNSFNAQAFGNVYAEVDPIPGLTLRTSIGGSYYNNNYRNYGRWSYENSENNSAFSFSQGNNYRWAFTFTNTAAYKKQFGIHNIDVLVGQEALNTGRGWNEDMSGLNPFSWDVNYVNMTNVPQASKKATSSQDKGINYASYFGNIRYTLKDRYILGFVLRRDGVSSFAAGHKYAVFPAVSAAWRLSSESFMQGVTWVSDLKIRGGYGTMGNSQGVTNNNQYSLYGGSIGDSGYDITGSNSSASVGNYRTNIGNPNTKWETNTTANIGIDGVLFDGKLDVIIDAWQRKTSDLLLQSAIPQVTGYKAAAPYVNAGSMTNRGIDLQLSTKGNITTDLKYEVTLNGSFLHNEITGVGGNAPYLTSINPGYRGIFPIRNLVGQSISSFFGYQVQGLFQNAEEVNNSPAQSGKGLGRFRYRDINGDGVIDDKDRTWLGSPVPKFTGGFNFTLRFKNFDLNGYLYTSLGNKIFNQSKWFTDFFPSFQGAAISNRIKDSWTPTNTGATTPIFESASNFSTNTQSNSFYVENGSYLRLQNITLGYTLPGALLQRAKLTKLRIYASTNNVFTITKYQGLDPSVGGSADTNFGIDIGNYPITRSYTVGVNLGF